MKKYLNCFLEFWSSHLNVRGPREAPKPQIDGKKTDTATSALPAAAPQASSDSSPQTHSNNKLRTEPESDAANKQPAPYPTVFQTFCPITTRSPKELDCGSSEGALCFINPLFLQSQDPLSRRRMFQRSVKIRVSTETATLLSPPLAPPPPPPLMPKTKGRCKAKAQKEGQGTSQFQFVTQTQGAPSEPQVQPQSATPDFKPEMEEQGQTGAGFEGAETAAQLLTVKEHLPDDSEYKQPSPVISSSHSPSLSPYLSLSPPTVPPIFPKVSPSLSPHNSPSVSPSLSPYQSPSLSRKGPISLSPQYSCALPSLCQSPSPSPKVPFSLSPFTSPSFSQLAEEAYHTPATHSRPDQQRLKRQVEEEGRSADEHKGEDAETNEEKTEDEEKDLVLQMNAACLNNSTLCKSVTQCN